MNQVLVIPGIDDREGPLKFLTNSWPRRFGLQPTVMAFGWGEPDREYEFRQAKILQKVEELARLGSLSVVGGSAGGHKAINLLAERPDLVTAAVNIGGYSQMGNWDGGTQRHAMLRHSLQVLSTQEFDPSRVMTIRPAFDGIVPAETVAVEGATNLRLGVPGHVFGIFWALGMQAQTIAGFIQSHE